ncbi:maltose alpha-D-glucosyltransferase [Thermocoleostomius sinensis]|uniref:Maltokinase n=1 Tax=Thermocoleostomius sinensis A174 TaxID=2016057 RepID=A0A9E8ZFT3_9CYAN|nr:maltose alpha-D-glucosyltransferase [Thermocoleostomius sinensis]WAL60987.1 maltose alpha-D-glucosyltransferase [Thermocoleostomius sinensis A174]
MHKSPLSDDPLWFKDAIIYEVPVKAFADSDGDGIGDFRGLTEKLDYIQDLGVTAIWILPFFPSPLRDDGYDIADYNSVNPIYGNLEDFQMFLDAAHQRGIRVIIELIVNHTSDQHPWFQRARKAPPGSSERDFYVWSDTPEKYRGVRIIFKDFETSNWTWDPVAKAYYWHRFYSHQPDLNFEHPELQKAIFDVVDFWLEMGVDGMRLDAVPYLYEQEGTICENLPQTHLFLKKLRAHIDEKFPNRMLLAEANQWPEDAAEYYGQGDECHMNFHFPLMPRLFMSLQMEDSFPILDILQQTPQIPSNCQWAVFLRNHDELTLEMVSDEDRDYMYKVYAQDPQARINLGIRRRLAPLQGNNRRRIELLNSLLLSMPGTPVLYYGDEIGMGDNIYLGDRNGVRTPMQWSADRNAGFSRTNPQKLFLPVIVDPEYHYETVNVEAQRANPNSLWWWTKRLIAVRSRFKAFGRGTFELLYPENRKVLAFTRTYEGEHILVVANLSRFVQAVELDLSAFKGAVPVEIFGRTEFPAVGEDPYFLSLGPHAFYWFTLQFQTSLVELPKPQMQLPVVLANGHWQDVYTRTESKIALESVLLDYLRTCRWMGSKIRILQTLEIIDAVPMESSQETAPAHAHHMVIVKVSFTEGIPETYVLPLGFAETGDGLTIESHISEHAIAYVQGKNTTGILFDAVVDKAFLTIPLTAIGQKRRYAGNVGEVIATPTDLFDQLCLEGTQPTQSLVASPQAACGVDPHLLRRERTNTLVGYGERFFLKLFHQVDDCINSDLEIGRFLTESSTNLGLPLPDNIAPVAGYLEYRRKGADPVTLGVLQKYIPETRDAWSYVLDNLRDAYVEVLTKQVDIADISLPLNVLKATTEEEIPTLAYEMMGGQIRAAELLGQRAAEMHLALAADTDNPSFAPEEFTSFYQRSIYQYMRNQSGKVLLSLQKQLKHLPEDLQPLAKSVLTHRERLMDRFKLVLEQPITTMRTRCHGNFHLEEVLYTGKDFVIIDFEGEPNRSLSERRMKRSPLRDVAGMLQSFYYASRVALRHEEESGMIRPENLPLMEQWAHFFYSWAAVAFLQQYLRTANGAAFLPKEPQELQVLLDAFLLEKVVYELGYELENRPDYVDIPLQRILELLSIAQTAG